MVPYTRVVAPATISARAAVAKRTTSCGAAGLRRPMSTMHDNDPETLEVEKRRNLTKQQHKTSTPHQRYAPGWNENLASTSEAYVKADRSDSISPAELQEETIEYVTARYSPDDMTSPTTANYSRDEVTGPLGTAKTGNNGFVQGIDSATSTSTTPSETVVGKTAKKTEEQTIEEKAPAGGYV